MDEALGLKEKAASALLWSASGQIAHQVISFATVLILARLLSPSDFGLLGFAAVVIAFFSIFQNFGFGLSIIQSKSITEEQISGLFWLNLFFSALLVLIVILAAPLVAVFFKEPRVKLLLVSLSMIFILEACSMVQAAQLEKELSLKKIAIINTSAIFVSSVVGITAAVLKYGVWSLVAYQIGQSAFKTLFLIFTIKWKPQLKIPLKKLKKQIRFSIFAQLSAVLNFFSRNVDDVLVGRVLGSSMLGLYQMSYRLMLWPLQKITLVIGRVLFPSLSMIQDDIERVKRIYLQVVGIIALVAFPMILGLFVISSPAILYILGEKWKDVIPIFQVLCLLGILQSISATQGWIFLSQGRTDLQLKVLFFSVIIIVTSFFIGIQFGAMGVAVCYTIASSVLIPFQLHIAGGLIRVSLVDIFRRILGSLLCASLMAGLVFVLELCLPENINPGVFLGIQITVGIGLYFLLVHILHLHSYMEVKRLLKEFWTRKKP